MSRRPRAINVKPSDAHLASAVLDCDEAQPIAEDSGGPWFLAAGQEVKPFVAVETRAELAACAREIMTEAEGDDDLTAAATENTEEADWTPAQRERTKAFVDGTLVTIADVERAARRARGLGDHERAKTFEMLAQVARGE